jgi:hypothetical protein
MHGVPERAHHKDRSARSNPCNEKNNSLEPLNSLIVKIFGPVYFKNLDRNFLVVESVA